jgi:hypothetical protein
MKIAKVVLVQWADGSCEEHHDVSVVEAGGGGASRSVRADHLQFALTQASRVGGDVKLVGWDSPEEQTATWAKYFEDLGWERPEPRVEVEGSYPLKEEAVDSSDAEDTPRDLARTRDSVRPASSDTLGS